MKMTTVEYEARVKVVADAVEEKFKEAMIDNYERDDQFGVIVVFTLDKWNEGIKNAVEHKVAVAVTEYPDAKITIKQPFTTTQMDGDEVKVMVTLKSMKK